MFPLKPWPSPKYLKKTQKMAKSLKNWLYLLQGTIEFHESCARFLETSQLFSTFQKGQMITMPNNVHVFRQLVFLLRRSVALGFEGSSNASMASWQLTKVGHAKTR
jgi:hypothetical protein